METKIARGFSIRIFLPEGSPTGLRLVEKSNWTGLGVVCPRPKLSEAKVRNEFSRAGVYVLLGPSDTSGIPIAYIGEGDPVKKRLEEHHSHKDFWTVAYFFTSKDANLNKAHIEYLEHRLCEIARSVKRCRLENENNPGKPSLSEADLADVETFLDEMLLCFPVLGVSIFERPEMKPANKVLLYLKKKGVDAEGYESEDGFVVKRNSKAIAIPVPSIQSYVAELREDLLRNGILAKVDGNFFVLTEDYEFTSPSTAASVLLAASVNGRDTWQTTDGVTLKELQERDGAVDES